MRYFILMVRIEIPNHQDKYISLFILLKTRYDTILVSKMKNIINYSETENRKWSNFANGHYLDLNYIWDDYVHIDGQLCEINNNIKFMTTKATAHSIKSVSRGDFFYLMISDVPFYWINGNKCNVQSNKTIALFDCSKKLSFSFKINRSTKSIFIPFDFYDKKTVYNIQNNGIQSSDIIYRLMNCLHVNDHLLAKKINIILQLLSVTSEPLSLELNIFNKINNVIFNNMNNCEFNIQFIADKLGISIRKIQYILKNEGMTFTDKVNNLRINNLILLLEQKNYNLDDAIYMSGFKNNQMANRVFNKIHGMSIKEHLKNMPPKVATNGL